MTNLLDRERLIEVNVDIDLRVGSNKNCKKTKRRVKKFIKNACNAHYVHV